MFWLILFRVLLGLGIYPAEVFPAGTRTTGHGIASSTGKIGAFIGVFTFPLFMSWNGLRAAETAAAGVSVLGAIVTYYMLPETKGKTLEELNEEAKAGSVYEAPAEKLFSTHAGASLTELMRYLTLASDYDGTLAHDGGVDQPTLQALERLLHSGRKLILVPGRELPDLQSVFPRLDLCERVVAENGAVLYNPATREKTILADRPPESFIESLRKRGVRNLSVGDVDCFHLASPSSRSPSTHP
jgi:hypothetical protein